MKALQRQTGLLIGLFFLARYYVVNYKWNHWDKYKIPVAPGTFPFDDLFMRKHVQDLKAEEYEIVKGASIFGSFLLFKPVLNIADPDLIKQILVKDFDSFVDRNGKEINKLTRNFSDQVWSRQITMLEGETWKEVRSTFSPIFTSGKMRVMKVFIDETCRKMIESLDKKVVAQEGNIDLKDLLGRFSMDTIASCAFGVDAKSLSGEPVSNLFVENASSLFERAPMDVAKFFALMLPGGEQILSFLGIPVIKPKETLFFVNIVKETLKLRREAANNSAKRNDLIDLMINAMHGEESNEEVEASDQFDQDSKLFHKRKHRQEVDEMDIISTAFVILIAGYDTTSQALAYAGYELARHQETQKKLREEIDTAYENVDNNILDYNTVLNLPYLDTVLTETLRLHPALGVLERVCTKDQYKVPGTNIVLQNQDIIHIPVYSIHTDEKFYPNPMNFEPERFSKENKLTRSPYTFLGFGQGPRSCLGMRFAMLEAKVALASIVKNFELHVCEKTVEEIKLDPKSILSANIGGIWVKAIKR